MIMRGKRGSITLLINSHLPTEHRQADPFVSKRKEYSANIRVYSSNASWLSRPSILTAPIGFVNDFSEQNINKSNRYKEKTEYLPGKRKR